MEMTLVFGAKEVHDMIERQAQSMFQAPAGFRWAAAAKYGYIPDVTVELVRDDEAAADARAGVTGLLQPVVPEAERITAEGAAREEG